MAEIPDVEVVNPEGKLCPWEIKKEQYLMQTAAPCTLYLGLAIKTRQERK